MKDLISKAVQNMNWREPNLANSMFSLNTLLPFIHFYHLFVHINIYVQWDLLDPIKSSFRHKMLKKTPFRHINY